MQGPRFYVYLKYSEIYPDAGPDQLWEGLQETPVIDAVQVLAWVSARLAANQDPALHNILIGQFLEPEVAAEVQGNAPVPPAVPSIFHRLGNLALIRNLALYGAKRDPARDVPATLIGRLALLQNEFIGREPDVEAPSNLELVALVIGTWDIYNPIETPSAARIYSILAEILQGTDPTIVNLRSQVDATNLTISGLTLPEFVAVVFGLFAFGLKRAREGLAAAFAPDEVFKPFPRAQRLLERFLQGRSLTLEGLAEKLLGGAPRTREQFLEDLSDTRALPACLILARQRPLLRLDDRVVILDLQFLADLLASGVYWSTFDSLEPRSRETFRELWGRAFELYVTGHLRAFYPVAASLLSIDIPYAGGQIDALLDFGPDVFVLEIKSSLLTDAAKRSGDREMLAKDIERKFIRNERGKPKAIAQLARAARSIAIGSIPTTVLPKRIYPILITDEPACECMGFNGYLNERFQQELAGIERVRPLTVMSIDECEQLLPYTASDAISWSDLCETRVKAGLFLSVGQTIYDLRQERGIEPQRNQILVAKFKEVYEAIQRIYTEELAQDNDA
jgi:hypothetical protein